MTSTRKDSRATDSNSTAQSVEAESIDWMELSAEELPDQFDLTGSFSTMFCPPACVSCIACEPQPMTMASVSFFDPAQK